MIDAMSGVLVSILKAVGDETRLRILQVLRRGAFHVNELMDILDLGQSRVSRHLKILSHAGLVTSRREGHFVFYLWPEQPSAVASAALEFLTEAWKQSGVETGEAEEQQIHAVWDARRIRSSSAFSHLPGTLTKDHERYFGSPDSIDCLLPVLGQGLRLAVDLGTGSGNLLPHLADRARLTIAVDQSSDLLQRARERAQGQGFGNIEYRLGQLEHLPVSDGAADLAVANMVLHHVAEPMAVLREARRILAPKGRLVVGDYALHDHEWMRNELGDQWLGFDPAQLRQWLRRAGFHHVEIRREKSDSSDLQILVASAEVGNAREMG